MKTGNKSRVLFLRGYLEEHTDDDHCLTTEDLICDRGQGQDDSVHPDRRNKD